MAHDIKAAFFDIDGTLVSFKTHRMPQSTRNALACLREQGIKCFISSGRPRYMLPPCIEDGFDAYVTLSGQFCFDAQGVYLDNPIPSADVATIVGQCNEGLYDLAVLEGGRAYVNKMSPRVVQACANAQVTFDLIDVNEALDNSVYQFNAFVDPSSDHLITEACPGVVTTRWCDVFADIIPATGGKPEGVAATCERYGIDVAQTIAFGDGDNDCGMLECVGTGVAMDNGTPAAKASADLTCESVDDDGIWKACERLGLL